MRCWPCSIPISHEGDYSPEWFRSRFTRHHTLNSACAEQPQQPRHKGLVVAGDGVVLERCLKGVGACEAGLVGGIPCARLLNPPNGLTATCPSGSRLQGQPKRSRRVNSMGASMVNASTRPDRIANRRRRCWRVRRDYLPRDVHRPLTLSAFRRRNGRSGWRDPSVSAATLPRGSQSLRDLHDGGRSPQCSRRLSDSRRGYCIYADRDLTPAGGVMGAPGYNCAREILRS